MKNLLSKKLEFNKKEELAKQTTNLLKSSTTQFFSVAASFTNFGGKEDEFDEKEDIAKQLADLYTEKEAKIINSILFILNEIEHISLNLKIE